MRNLIWLVSIKNYSYITPTLVQWLACSSHRPICKCDFVPHWVLPHFWHFAKLSEFFINIYFLLQVNFITQTISKAPTVTESLKHASYKSIHWWNDFTFYWVPKTISFNFMFLQKVGNRDSLQIPFFNYLWNVMTFSKESGVVSSLNGPGFK